MRPPSSSSTMSVKVPPMSTPTRKRAVMSLFPPGSSLENPGQPQRDVGEDHHQEDTDDVDQHERRHPDEDVGDRAGSDPHALQHVHDGAVMYVLRACGDRKSTRLNS